MSIGKRSELCATRALHETSNRCREEAQRCRTYLSPHQRRRLTCRFYVLGICYPLRFKLIDAVDAKELPTLSLHLQRSSRIPSVTHRSGFSSNIKDFRGVYVGAGEPPLGGNASRLRQILKTRRSWIMLRPAVCRPQHLNKAVLNTTGKNIDIDEASRLMAVCLVQKQPTPISSTILMRNWRSRRGSYNVGVLLPKGIAANGPAVSSTIFHDGHGTPYNVQVYAQVHSIEPALGSLKEAHARNKRLRFPEALDQIAVRVGGPHGGLVVCDVLQATFTSITA